MPLTHRCFCPACSDPFYAARLQAPSYILEVVGAIFETFADNTLLLFWLIYLDRLQRVRGRLRTLRCMPR